MERFSWNAVEYFFQPVTFLHKRSMEKEREKKGHSLLGLKKGFWVPEARLPAALSIIL